jgi:RNA polymerase sigma-70 factor (ECF subfamily)
MDPTGAGHKEGVALAVFAEAPPPADDLADFPALYEKYFDFVWRSVRRLGVADKSLDDATQDVFIVVHRKLADFEGRSSLKSWIFGIARRVAHDHRRLATRKDRGTVPVDGLVDLYAPNPRDTVARAEAVRVLYEFLDTLDADKREAFVLAELEQMTVPEISAAVGANINTIYSRLRAARKAFDQAVSRLHAKEAGTAQRKATR